MNTNSIDHDKGIDEYYDKKQENCKREWAKLCELRRTNAPIKEIMKQEKLFEFYSGSAGD